MKERPEVLEGKTHTIKTGYGRLYVTVNLKDGEPYEVFATIGKCGKSIQVKTEVIGRLISLSLRYGAPLKDIIHQLSDLTGEYPLAVGKDMIKSLPDAIGIILSKYYLSKEKVE